MGRQLSWVPGEAAWSAAQGTWSSTCQQHHEQVAGAQQPHTLLSNGHAITGAADDQTDIYNNTTSRSRPDALEEHIQSSTAVPAARLLTQHTQLSVPHASWRLCTAQPHLQLHATNCSCRSTCPACPCICLGRHDLQIVVQIGLNGHHATADALLCHTVATFTG
eukprot:GHUV01033326.1.p1 GENE.GHUV01033326.1~~GHUV01033326.1.p1  ORF type:complete len:164 (+),score=40.35 GHUV01033326.1:166-657(+)